MRAAGIVLAFVVVLLAAAVQVAMSAAYGGLALAGSLPARIAGDWPLQLAQQLHLDAVGPLRLTLARAAVYRGDAAYAQQLLAAAGNGSTVADLRGRLALRAGDTTAALRWFAAAGDFAAARGTIDALAGRDPLAAYAVVRAFDERLSRGGALPEVAADLIWREGQLAAAIAYARPAEALRYNTLALAAYRRALALAPNEETYLLAFGYQSLVLGDARGARDAYAAAARVVPDSVDAFAGWAAAAATLGDCAAARRILARAQTETDGVRLAGYGPLIRAPLARCDS